LIEPVDRVVMPQVEEVLGQLDQGRTIQELVREERRRTKKKLERSANKLKKLKILDSKKEVNSRCTPRPVCDFCLVFLTYLTPLKLTFSNT
jgi:hypothetical protein